MDHGKFIFEERKKQQVAKKKQKQVQVKEIKFRPGTEDGDYQVKLRNLTRFLTDGDRVKVTLRFRGREMAHQELGRDLLKRVEGDLAELGTVEQFPRMEGRQMVMLIAPKKKKYTRYLGLLRARYCPPLREASSHKRCVFYHFEMRS